MTNAFCAPIAIIRAKPEATPEVNAIMNRDSTLESELDGGRYWDRTSDPHNVNVVLYR